MASIFTRIIQGEIPCEKILESERFFAFLDIRPIAPGHTLLKQESAKHGVRVLAYCLMTNHVHLVLVPQRAESLALAVGRTHWLYTQRINRLHGRLGHLWQNRFFSCALDGDHVLHAVCYVERNPVMARLVRLAWNYRWSSAAAHVGESDASGVLDPDAWHKKFSPREWRGILQRPLDKKMHGRLESALSTGRPLAGDRWLARVEAKLNRRLRAMPVGRPKRTAKGDKSGRARRGRRTHAKRGHQ
jgi:putative transposase